MKRNPTPIHPGKILEEEFLVPLGLSINTLASSISIDDKTLTDVVSCKKSVNAELDFLLANYFKLSVGYWLSIQQKHDKDF